MQSDYRDRIGLATWAVTMFLALGSLLRLPGEGTQLALAGLSLDLPFDVANAVPVLPALLAGAGAEAVVRAHPLARLGELRLTMRFWALPVAVTLIAIVVLPLAPSTGYWGLGLLVFAVLLSSVLVALFYSLNPNAAGYRRARSALNLICYAIALLLFLLVPEEWGNLARAVVLGGVTLLLSLELLRGARARVSAVTLYALVVGFVVAQVAWVLPLTELNMLASGLLLLLLFYLFVGLAWQSLMDRLTRQVALEFGAVGLGGLLLILIFAA